MADPSASRARVDPAPPNTLLGWEISRRKFVAIAGGGGAAIAVLWGSGSAVLQSLPARSPFWTIRVVRAGRGARLTTDGLPAFRATPGPSVFAMRPSPAVVTRAGTSSGGHAVTHSGGTTGFEPALGSSSPQPENLTWGDVVVLEVEVRNTADVPMLLSPGQLRLALANGQTITPGDASRGPQAIAAGAAEMLWVSYLAPSDAADFSVEFTDPQHDALLALGVPRLVTAKEQS